MSHVQLDAARLAADGTALFSIAQSVSQAVRACESALGSTGGMAGDDESAEVFAHGQDGEPGYDQYSVDVMKSALGMANALRIVDAALGNTGRAYDGAQLVGAFKAASSSGIPEENPDVVPPSASVPTSLGKGPEGPLGEFGSFLKDALATLGVVLPSADRGKLSSAESAWSELSSAMTRAQSRVENAFTNASSMIFPQKYSMLSCQRSLGSSFGKVAESATSMSGFARGMIDAIDQAWEEIGWFIAQMAIEIGIEIGVGALLGMVTFGAGAAAMAAKIMTTVVRWAIKISLLCKKLRTLIMMALRAARLAIRGGIRVAKEAISAGLASGITTVSFNTVRGALDPNFQPQNVLTAALSAAVGGAAGAGFSGAGGRLTSGVNPGAMRRVTHIAVETGGGAVDGLASGLAESGLSGQPFQPLSAMAAGALLGGAMAGRPGGGHAPSSPSSPNGSGNPGTVNDIDTSGIPSGTGTNASAGTPGGGASVDVSSDAPTPGSGGGGSSTSGGGGAVDVSNDAPTPGSGGADGAGAGDGGGSVDLPGAVDASGVDLSDAGSATDAPSVDAPTADAPAADAPAADAPAHADGPTADGPTADGGSPDAPAHADAPAADGAHPDAPTQPDAPTHADAPAHADGAAHADAPAADAPAAHADAPATDAPAHADAPAGDAPAHADAPAADAPVTETPAAETPAADAPAHADAPAGDAPALADPTATDAASLVDALADIDVPSAVDMAATADAVSADVAATADTGTDAATSDQTSSGEPSGAAVAAPSAADIAASADSVTADGAVVAPGEVVTDAADADAANADASTADEGDSGEASAHEGLDEFAPEDVAGAGGAAVAGAAALAFTPKFLPSHTPGGASPAAPKPQGPAAASSDGSTTAPDGSTTAPDDSTASPDGTTPADGSDAPQSATDVPESNGDASGADSADGDADTAANNSSTRTVEEIDAALNSINPNYDPTDPSNGYATNCGNTSANLNDFLNGTSSVEASTGTLDVAQMEGRTGNPQTPMTPDQIASTLTAMGPGSHCVVGIDRSSGDGHWFNAYYDGTQVWSLDAQTGTRSPWPPHEPTATNWDASIQPELVTNPDGTTPNATPATPDAPASAASTTVADASTGTAVDPASSTTGTGADATGADATADAPQRGWKSAATVPADHPSDGSAGPGTTYNGYDIPRLTPEIRAELDALAAEPGSPIVKNPDDTYSLKTPIDVDAFTRAEPHHKWDEFQRQVGLQQQGLNKLTVAEWQHNVKFFRAEDRVAKSQQSRAIKALKKLGVPFTNPAVLHGPDQSAGGRADRFDGAGDSPVNSSLGAAWSGRRITDLFSDVHGAARKIDPKLLAHVHMNVHLGAKDAISNSTATQSTLTSARPITGPATTGTTPAGATTPGATAPGAPSAPASPNTWGTATSGPATPAASAVSPSAPAAPVAATGSPSTTNAATTAPSGANPSGANPRSAAPEGASTPMTGSSTNPSNPSSATSATRAGAPGSPTTPSGEAGAPSDTGAAPADARASDPVETAASEPSEAGQTGADQSHESEPTSPEQSAEPETDVRVDEVAVSEVDSDGGDAAEPTPATAPDGRHEILDNAYALRGPESTSASVAAINQGYHLDARYQFNCHLVVNALELRLRGYDVEVSPTAGTPRAEMRSPYSIARDWQQSDGTTREFEPLSQHGDSVDDALANLTADWEVGSRGFIGGMYKTGGGHVFTIVKEADGLKFYDSQVNSMDASAQVGRMVFKPESGDPRMDINVLRVSDLDPTDRTLKTSMRPEEGAVVRDAFATRTNADRMRDRDVAMGAHWRDHNDRDIRELDGVIADADTDAATRDRAEQERRGLVAQNDRLRQREEKLLERISLRPAGGPVGEPTSNAGD